MNESMTKAAELKPCTKYQEEINELHRMKKQLLGPQGCCCQTQQQNKWKADCLSAAIYALSWLQSHARPVNELLALEQLREMDGETVYCVDINANVKVQAPSVGIIRVRYNTPGESGTLNAKGLILRRLPKGSKNK